MRRGGQVTPREWRRVIVSAALVMMVTTVPYLVGWSSSNDQWTFSGFLFGTDDGNSYLAKMRLGARGEWLFTIRYTHEAHDGALLFLPYIVLGKLAALFAAPDSPDHVAALIVVFHAARIVFGFTLLLVSYRFAAEFLPRPDTRMAALLLIAFGGGLGWLLSLAGAGKLFGSLPVDLYVPEGYSFLILFGLPHLALSRTVMLLGMLLMFRALETAEEPRLWLRWTLPAGMMWAVMGLSVPFYIAALYLLLGCWGLAVWLRRRSFPWALFWRVMSAALVPLPVLIYTAIVFVTNDVLGEWSGQNNLPSPHPLHYVFGYVVIALPALAAVRWAWRRGSDPQRLPSVLLLAWVVAAPIAVYLPVNVQRRLAEGVIVPLSILAVAGLRLWFPSRQAWRRARVAVLVPAVLTSVLLWVGGLFSATATRYPLFNATNDIHAMEQLNTVAPEDAVVLSTKDTGNILPAYTDLVAYTGHGPETLQSDRKSEQAERFFSGVMPPGEQQALLDVVDYVFVGSHERDVMVSPASAWAVADQLRRLDGFAVGTPVEVYEVKHSD